MRAGLMTAPLGTTFIMRDPGDRQNCRISENDIGHVYACV